MFNVWGDVPGKATARLVTKCHPCDISCPALWQKVSLFQLERFLLHLKMTLSCLLPSSSSLSSCCIVLFQSIVVLFLLDIRKAQIYTTCENLLSRLHQTQNWGYCHLKHLCAFPISKQGSHDWRISSSSFFLAWNSFYCLWTFCWEMLHLHKFFFCLSSVSVYSFVGEVNLCFTFSNVGSLKEKSSNFKLDVTSFQSFLCCCTPCWVVFDP